MTPVLMIAPHMLVHLAALPARERAVLEMRLGLATGEPMTFAAIAARLGVSRQRAKQIEQRAMGQLRRWAADAPAAADPASERRLRLAAAGLADFDPPRVGRLRCLGCGREVMEGAPPPPLQRMDCLPCARRRARAVARAGV